MKNGICPKCDSCDVVGNIPKQSFGFGMGMYAVAKGRGLSIMQTPADTRAWICTACGFTEFYTTNAAAIGKAVDRAIRHEEKQKTRSATPVPVRVSSGDGA